MRKPVIGAFAALLLLALTPTVAQAATAPCAPSDKYAPLGLNGARKPVTPSPVPGFEHELTGQQREESLVHSFFRLDVSGSPQAPDATMGDVEVRLTWDNRSDYDLYVYDGSGNLLGSSVTFNLLSGTGREQVVAAKLPHCTDLRIDVLNYLGLPTLAMELNLSVSNPA